MYDGLSSSGLAFVKIASWITLSVSLCSTSHYPKFPIRPYQTLLITNPQLVPHDAADDLVRFVAVCKPSKSFQVPLRGRNCLRYIMILLIFTRLQDMQMELNVHLSQLYRMAAHLLYWRIGKIVSTMTTSNVYVVNPDMELSPRLMASFERDFTGLSLVEQLERFSFPKPVKSHLGDISLSHKQFSEVLVWMLRRDIIIHLFTYLLLIVPEREDPSSAALSAGDAVGDACAYGASDDDVGDGDDVDEEEEEELEQRYLPASKAKLTACELAYIASVTVDDTPLDRLFVRLCNYARGRHHLEEITWRENLTRDDIFAVLRDPKYHALIAVEHEDACVVTHDCVRPSDEVL